jgi:Flp pilus assembly protein TadD
MKSINKAEINKAKRLFIEGRNLHKAGEFAKAEASYKHVLKLIPTQPDALHMLGVAAFQQDRFEEAEQLIATAIRFKPNSALTYYNHGNALRKLGRFDAAIQAFTKALELDGSHILSLEQIGNIYKELNQFDKAYRYYDQLLSIDPNNAIGRSNKAIALLTEGKLTEGWELYESRLDSIFEENHLITNLVPRLVPDWDGRRPSKPLLVLPEQGLGDQIFYGGMLTDLEIAGVEALVCVDERIVPLFQRSFPSLMFATLGQVAALEQGSDLFGAQVTMASMGQWLRRSAADFQKIRSPLLKCEQNRSIGLRNILKKSSRLRIGLSWQSLHAKHGPTKSCNLDQLLPLLKLENIDFIDLQYGDTAGERAQIHKNHKVDIQRLDFIDNKMDIEGLAALIDACDIVITVSNTTAHLAAALGKPTLVLLPWHSPLWYWHLESMGSPWYPSAVLLRQDKPGDWSGPLNKAIRFVQSSAQLENINTNLVFFDNSSQINHKT